MNDQGPAELAEIEAMLLAALGLADRIGESLLGAKIDEALECAREIRQRQRRA